MRRLILAGALALLAVPWWGSGARAADQCFAETGQCIAGRFAEYWGAHGGLAINGFPLTGERVETLEDGKSYTVQYYERVRLELHPENAAPNDILLGQFGRTIHPADPPVSATAGATYFAQTGHNVAPDLAAFWQANGGLAQFGYPLTEEITEMLEDGKSYTVQYYERARFERHPENAAPNTILLGQFGRRILLAGPATPPAPSVPPATPGCGSLPASFSGGQTYHDPQGRFTAQYPNNWTARPEADGNVSVVAPSGAGVTLAVADAPGRQLEEYKNQILQQIQAPSAANGHFELLCQDRVQVGPFAAYRLRFLHNRIGVGGQPVPELIDRVFFLAGGRSFTANGFLVPDDTADLALLERIAASLTSAP